MRICDDERRFREAVAAGQPIAEAARLVKPHCVKLFTRRLPKRPQIRAGAAYVEALQERQLQPVYPPAPETVVSSDAEEALDGEL